MFPYERSSKHDNVGKIHIEVKEFQLRATIRKSVQENGLEQLTKWK
jgi:hypothetical protein